MRRPRFLGGSRNTSGPGTSTSPTAPPDDPARAAERTALAAEHGWIFAPRNQRAIQGWPRPVLPPGPLGEVRNVLTGRHERRPFRVFDYVYGVDGDWATLVVATVALPGRLPFLEITDESPADSATHDVYAESPEPNFALDLMSPEVSAAIREHGFRRLVVDDNELICTAEGGGPADVAARIAAMGEVVDRIPVAVWARWAQ